MIPFDLEESSKRMYLHLRRKETLGLVEGVFEHFDVAVIWTYCEVDEQSC